MGAETAAITALTVGSTATANTAMVAAPAVATTSAAAASAAAMKTAMVLGAAGAVGQGALGVAQSRAQNRAIESQQALAARQLQATKQNLAQRAQIQKRALAKRAQQIRASVRVGVGAGGSQMDLLRQVDFDQGLNVRLIDENRNVAGDEATSIFNAQVLRSESGRTTPLISGVTGAIGGATTGLSIANTVFQIKTLADQMRDPTRRSVGGGLNIQGQPVDNTGFGWAVDNTGFGWDPNPRAPR
jgi:hypothetical protein